MTNIINKLVSNAYEFQDKKEKDEHRMLRIAQKYQAPQHHHYQLMKTCLQVPRLSR